MTKLRTMLSAMVLTAIVVTPASGADSLDKARELYAAASYEDALAMLNVVDGASQTRAERQTMGLYRVLCLVALGRTPEAHAAIDAVIAQDPFQRPVLDDLPPKMRRPIHAPTMVPGSATRSSRPSSGVRKPADACHASATRRIERL